ncbi:MAG: hypothetical protein Q4C01_08065 [Clostridia bacterium]|nr:hypothetical protein [Clostridia bacterium]
MNRILALLLAALLLCGCGGGTNGVNVSSEPAKGVAPEQTEIIDVAEPTTEADTPTSEPVDTAEPDPQQPVAFSVAPFSNEPHSSSLPTVVTLVKAKPTSSDEDGIVLHEMWNQELDFQGFCLALDEFKVDESGAVLRFTVTLPDSWTDEIKEAMRDNGLRFRICLDETETDAFRTRTVSELENNSYTVQYSSCVLPIRDWQSVGEISIVPDVINASSLNSMSPYKQQQLSQNSAVKFFSIGMSYSGGTIAGDGSQFGDYGCFGGFSYKHNLLTALALTFTVNENPTEFASAEWVEYPFMVYEELFEENDTEGYYDKQDSADAPKAKVSLISKSFEGATFSLTRLCFRESGPQMEFHLNLPNSWTDKEVNSLYSFFGGCITVSVTAIDKNGNTIEQAFYAQRRNTEYEYLTVENYLTENYRDVYFYASTSKEFNYESCKNIAKLIIVPEYSVYTQVGDSIVLSEEPIVSSEWPNQLARSVIRLDELAITVDIDETIFNAGL